MSTGNPGTPALPASDPSKRPHENLSADPSADPSEDSTAPGADGAEGAVNPFVKPLLLVDVDGPVNPTTLRVRKDDSEAAAFVVHLMRPRGHEELSPEEFARQMAERRMQRMSGLKIEGKPGDPLRVRISALHVDEFASLSEVFEVVWATTWLDEANKFLSPLLGLPQDLAWVPFTAEEMANKNRPQVGRRGGSWKTPIIARWLEANHSGRAWAWVDDEVNQRDRTWFRDHHYGLRASVPHLILRVDDHRGLRSDDFTLLREFAQEAATSAAMSVDDS